MKKSFTSYYPIMIVLSSAWLATAGLASDTFFDSKGFEEPDYHEGLLQGQNGWQELSLHPGYAVIQKKTVHSGQQAVQIIQQGGQSYYGALLKVHSVNQFLLDIWIYPQTSRENGNTPYAIQVFNGKHTKQYGGLNFNSDGLIYAEYARDQKTGGCSLQPLGKFEIGTWMHVQLVHDCTKSSYKVIINERQDADLPFADSFDEGDSDIAVQISGYGGINGLPLMIFDDMSIRGVSP